MMNVRIRIFYMSGDPTVLRRIGRWALKDEFNLDGIDDVVFIKGPKSSNGGMVELKVEYEINSCLNWLSNLPEKKNDETENSVDVNLSGKINFWKAHDIISQIGRLKFLVNRASAETCEGLDDTDFSISFQMPVSYFMESQAETQTQAIVTKESAQTKNEAPSTENEMLQELKALVCQSKSELDMLKNIALFLKFDLQDTELLRRAYEDYKGLSKKENKQLRDALALFFNGKRLDHAMKKLKKLYAQYHPTTAAVEFTISEKAPVHSSELEEKPTSTPAVNRTEAPEEKNTFDNVGNEIPVSTEKGQKGDGDDTSSEDGDDQEEDSHT